MNSYKMKDKKKEGNQSKSKLQNKKNNNKETKSNNPLNQIKYLCFNEVKKIVNNKNNKSPYLNKNNEIIPNFKKRGKIKAEEEDCYNKIIYDKKIIIPHILSFINLSKTHISKIENLKKYNSTDERYKNITKYGLYTKKIFHSLNKKKNLKKNLEPKKNKFCKKDKLKKKNKNILKINNSYHYNFLDIHDITNMNSNNIIYRSNNIYDSNNTLTSNSITSKTITNNTMSNYTISNIGVNSYNNQSNNIISITNTNTNNNQNKSKNKGNNKNKQVAKNNNIKIIKTKGRNKNNNVINKNKNQNENPNPVFVRRIILEEKYTIEPNGDKKTISIKKVSPIMRTKETQCNSGKKIIYNNKNIKNNNKDNTFINHNDINLNFNVCSFNKIDLNNNNIGKEKDSQKKVESFENENKYNNNNDSSIYDDKILENYKDYLSIKNGNKIIYQKPNGTLFKSEKKHKSYQSLFSSPKKRYIIQIGGNGLNKKKYKINPKSINNYLSNNNKNKNIIIKKSSIRDLKSNNSSLKNKIIFPRYLKNKMVHRKTKTTILPNNLESYDLIDYIQNDEENISTINKRSLSYIGKAHECNLVNKYKDNKELNNKFKISPIELKSFKNHVNNLDEYLNLSPFDSGKSSKNNTKKNSINNSKYLKTNKSNLCITINDGLNNNQGYHSLNKINSSNDIPLFFNYLKRHIYSNNARNKSHGNFLIKRKQKESNKKANININKGKKNEIILMKTKVKNNEIKNK